MSHDSKSSPSWWQTVPGVLTAIAAIITAVTGLVVALSQAGVLRGFERHVPQNARIDSPSHSLPAEDRAAIDPVQSTKLRTLEPALREITVGEARYVILGLTTAPRSLESFSLRISIRVFNNSAYPVNFWNRSFRLLVDDVPRAPVGDLNKSVDGRSAEEGEIEFIVPSTAASLILQVYGDSEATEIPLHEARR